jgi:hypothetical protein
LPLATGCLDYERKYEFFTRNEIGAGAKYFQDSTFLMLTLALMLLILLAVGAQDETMGKAARSLVLM